VPDPVASFRLRVRVGEAIAVGPGKIDLLEAIDATGSLTTAARAIGMSYRRAWMLLDELNRSMREPAVETAAGGRSGGGSVLTASGRELLELYRRIDRTAQAANATDLDRLKRLLA
jgi:molybdate transport system regulatory protein